MNNGVYHDAMGLNLVEDKVRKPTDYCPTDVSKDSGLQLRIDLEPVQHLLHPFREFDSKSGALSLIPVNCGVEVGSGFVA
jgi:hypothetical protein